MNTMNYQGTSERCVGEFIASHRGEVVLATKYTNAAPGKERIKA